MVEVLSFIGDMLGKILNIELPFGLTFGSLLIGIAFFSILFSVLRAIFTDSVGS